MADVVFPLETHAEKDGTVTHPDGRLQRVRPSAARPGDIRPNWGVLAELSLALGHDTGIDSQPSAFAALTEAVPFYSGITDAEIGGRGIRWQDGPAAAGPAAPERSGGVRRRPAPRTTQRGRSGGVREPGPRAQPSGDPRRWHVPRPLGRSDHRAESAAEVPGARSSGSSCRSADAERLGLKSGDEVRVAQNGTSVAARVAIKERIPEGVCFLIEGTAEGNANALLNGGPVSVEIEKVGAADAAARRHPVRRSDLDHGRQVAGDLRRDLRDPAADDGRRAQADRPLPAPLRAQPGRPLRPPAAARRRRQADQQAGLPPGQRDPDAVRARAAAAGPLRRAGAGDHPLGRRPGRRRPLRDRRPDRHPLLLRRRLDRLLRPAARRLVLGLQIQPARRDARRRPADLLRGLDGPGAARRDHDGRLALAGRHRRRPGRRSGSSSPSSSAS